MRRTRRFSVPVAASLLAAGAPAQAVATELTGTQGTWTVDLDIASPCPVPAREVLRFPDRSIPRSRRTLARLSVRLRAKVRRELALLLVSGIVNENDLMTEPPAERE